MQTTLHTAEDIRREAAESTLRPRDTAARLGISEAEFTAAHVGHGVIPITAVPDLLMPQVCTLGEVMALTRNDSAVHERTGTYVDFHPGDHAAMVLGEEIDLRIFPKHWVHGFAWKNETDQGTRRSLQVFDSFGEAVHKIYPRDGTDLANWDRLVDKLTVAWDGTAFKTQPAPGAEAARSLPEKTDVLRTEWRRMTDTHQFLRLVSKLKMNRLGAYRIAGEPFACPLAPNAADQVLQDVATKGVPIMLFVGNRGCIQIHSGHVETLKPMGPWQNVLDPRFNLHLRRDHVAEVWLVEKPTKRGPALSVEAFAADGALIYQLFGLRKEGADYTEDFAKIAQDLPAREIPE